MKGNKEAPNGVGAPIGGNESNTNEVYHKKPWMASADDRCWGCERFKNDTCNGLIDYHWRDCPKNERG